MIRYSKLPNVELGPLAVFSVIEDAILEGALGLDFEGTVETGPTIIGVATKSRAAACDYTRELGLKVLNCGVPLVAYSGIGADKPMLETALRVKTPLSRWRDPMRKHWILHPDLASVAKSSYGDDRDDSGTMGMMNLWIATMLLHDVPKWKSCLSELNGWGGEPTNASLAEICVERKRICPVHNVYAYCGIDAWAGLVDDYAMDDLMRQVEIPYSYYEWRAEVAEYCQRMQFDPDRGLEVDLDAAYAIDEAIKSKKAALFPCTLDWDSKAKTKKSKYYTCGFVGCECVAEAPNTKLLAKECYDHQNKRTKPTKGETVETVPGKKLTKPRVIWEGPFNPNSPQAALQWFSDHGIHLRDKGGKPSMAKSILLDVIERKLRPYSLKLDPKSGLLIAPGDEVDSESSPLPDELDMLVRMGQKTILGKGLKSWVNTDYIYNGRFRPRFIDTGTSTSRLSSAKINVQNVPARGFGIEVRRIFTARPGYCLVKADASQLEFRIILWFAGQDPSLCDGAFEQLVTDSDGKFEAAAKLNNMTGRDVAKSVIHGGDYLEGIKLLTERELSNPQVLADRGAGALQVWDGRDLPLWKFRGRIVCFTCNNLSERLFGNKIRANRAKAHDIQNVFFKRFPAIREFQMKVAREIEETYEVRLPSGHRVELYGKLPEDDLKYAMAIKGQGGGAVYIQEGMVRFGKLDRIADLQVHDELVFTSHLRPEATDEECLDYMLPMVQESSILPGFWCPAKVARSLNPGTEYTDKSGKVHVVKTHNWKETRELGTIRK